MLRLFSTTFFEFRKGGRKKPRPPCPVTSGQRKIRSISDMSGNVELTGHGAGQLRTLNFKVRSSVSQMAHRVLFLVMFRRTGRFFANFGSFRTRRKNRTFGKWRTCRVVLNSGQFRTRRPAEFLTNTTCSSSETRSILLAVDVG